MSSLVSAAMDRVEKKIPVLKTANSVSANVLIVEDDFETANVLAHCLLEEGYGVRSALCREQALEILDSYLYDIILLDYSMPGMRAKEFVEKVRRRIPRSQFILITAAGQIEERAEELGIKNWLGKPFDPEALLKKIRAVSSAQK